MIGATARSELAAGWRILVACALGVGLSAIALPFYTIGPLSRAVEAAMGWSRADVLAATIFSSGLGALMAPVTGWLVDRFGPRAVAMPSLAGVGLGLAIAAQAETLAVFYLGFALAAVLGAGTNPVLWSRVITGSFEAGRGTALGLALVGTALTAIAMPYVVGWATLALGWRGALLLVASLPVLLALPIVYLWLKPVEREAHGLPPVTAGGRTVGEALGDHRFWLLGASILASYLAISGIIANLVPSLADRGVEPIAAASVAAAIGLAMIPGRILIGMLVDRFWAPGVGMVVLLLPVLSCLVLARSVDPLLLFWAAALLGLAAGAELDLLAYLTARYFGLPHYARIYALLYTALAAGSALAPTLFARLAGAAGQQTAFMVAGGLFALAALLLPLLGRYPMFGDGPAAGREQPA